jgi:pantetheine-phosphate adenylyltransferase
LNQGNFGLRISDCGLTDFNPQSEIRNPQSETSLMSRRAIYTGSFDPITLGHLNVIERSARLVDELIVGVGINIEKEALFSADERVALIRRVTDPLGNVVVKPFSGLAVRFVRECDARVIIRGVRSLSDMDSEFTMTLANRKLDPGIETVYLMADEEYSHVSSSLIKQITPLAGDEELARFVPRAIIPDLRRRIQERGDSGGAPSRGY